MRSDLRGYTYKDERDEPEKSAEAGDSWSVVYNVPKAYQRLVGKREIVRALGTKDVQEAMRLKHAKLLEIQAGVHRVVNGHREDTFTLMREARGIAQDRQRMDPHGDELAAFDQQTIDRAEAIADRDKSSRRAHRFADVAFGRATPISVAAEDWRAQWKGISQRTRAKYEHTLSLFQEFFADQPVDRITRRDAIEYIEHLKVTPSEKTGKLCDL